MIKHSKILNFKTPNYDDLDKEIPGGKGLVGAELHYKHKGDTSCQAAFIHFQRLTEGTSTHTHGLFS